jgi:pyruvate formate lyase activating enzyme
MKEALFWEPIEEGRVHCLLCPQDCRIGEGRRGVCQVRINKGGTLYSEVYDRIMAANMDPIEKKPLYHFHPGSAIFSIGTRGCNQRCDFCQNWHMLEPDARTGEITSRQVVDMAKERDSIGIAYTYNEPTIWYEFVLECAQLAREENLTNVLVSNGFVCELPFRRLAPLVDAMNIDVKSMDPDFYRRICKSKLEPVLETCRIAKETGIELEITNLLIPTLNDSGELIEKLVDFVAGLGPETPLHFSAYFPAHRMTIEATPVSTLIRAREIAAEKLYYVYLGNVASSEGSNTYCPRCGHLLVSRSRYEVSIKGIEGEDCANCGRKVDIVL